MAPSQKTRLQAKWTSDQGGIYSLCNRITSETREYSMDPGGETLGDATVCTAESTTSLPDHSPSPAEHACHTICELHKLRFKLFGTQIYW